MFGKAYLAAHHGPAIVHTQKGTEFDLFRILGAIRPVAGSRPRDERGNPVCYAALASASGPEI